MSELVQKGQAKMYKENPQEEGGREELGDYKQSLLPGGGKSHRVFWDSTKRVYDIDLPKDKLNEIALKMRLIDSETKKIIETADKYNEYDPFFKHEKLEIFVPNSGISLDTETVEGEYWWAAIQSEPKTFDVDNSTDNPLVKKIQSFKVTTAGHSEEEVSRDVKEGQRATAIYHAIKTDYKQMINICRGLDIVIGENPAIPALQDAIFLKITTQKDWKTKDGSRNIEKFLALTDMPKAELELTAKISEAIGLGIIVRVGKQYEFDQVQIGSTPEKVKDFLNKKEERNQTIRQDLLARIAEMSGVLA